MPNVVGLTYKNGVQKGPATDYSMLLEMKRRRAVIADQLAKNPKGDQTTKPFMREGNMKGGTTPNGGTGAVEFYKIKGIQLNVLKF
jgi:hypothetical protein